MQYILVDIRGGERGNRRNLYIAGIWFTTEKRDSALRFDTKREAARALRDYAKADYLSPEAARAFLSVEKYTTTQK